jgi:redox-sensitive bicupin YhaK (pirin superfamily)
MSVRRIDYDKMGKADHGWLSSHFHFSFDRYRNPDNVQFGVLRVLNDDTVQPGKGFDPHPHSDMEIVSYVIEGELTHRDSMDNERTLSRGQVQYMSAGTGVVHSEYNNTAKPLRWLQIWILPDKKGYDPAYGDFAFVFEDRMGRWLPLVTYADNAAGGAPIRIHADVNISAAVIPAGGSLDLPVAQIRQAYLVDIEGESDAGAVHLRRGDALEIVEEGVTLTSAPGGTHLLVIEMAKAAG